MSGNCPSCKKALGNTVVERQKFEAYGPAISGFAYSADNVVR
jgi:hypothetical protein